jgi:hypothetical protein
MVFVFTTVIAEDSEKVRDILSKNIELISSTAEEFHMNARLVAAIIYTERSLNVSWMEDELDILLASAGYSSSIGIGQVKIHTAQWIEKKIRDSSSHYYLGGEYRNMIPSNMSRDSLVQRLQDARWNVRYVTAYAAMFCCYWQKEGFDISKRPEILGALYSLGPYRVSDGSERKPHGKAEPNYFGIKTKEFYDSNDLIDLFPRIR